MELIWKIEALLFAVGDKISEEEVAKLTKADKQEVHLALRKLRNIYNERDTALMISNEEDLWKFNVKESYLKLVRKIIVRTELPKSVMETLAVLAWKAPMKQSELVDIRSNKAYDHLAELSKMGFIQKERHGRTYLLKLTQKFFDYFELTGKKEIQEKFAKFDNFEKNFVPQKQIDEYEKPEDRIEVYEQQQAQLEQEIEEHRDQDKDFLSEMDKKINATSQQSVAKEFEEMIPRQEPEQEDSEQEAQAEQEESQEEPEERKLEK